jgi:SAM-dependent methyltransferase
MGDKVIASILAVLAELPPGLLLDIPAGSSPIATGARALGWCVVGLDLFRSPAFAGVQADACAPLPFRDGAFDALVSLEGIEHFENQAAFLRECARVLRPGGCLILSTPNVLHLSGRLSWFLTGQRQLKRGVVNEDQTLRAREGQRLYHGHAFLIDAYRLRYLMRIAGLCPTGLLRGKLSRGSLALAPLAPLVWAATRFSLWSGARTRAKAGLASARPEVERELYALTRNPGLAFSRKLVMTARREPPAGPP